MISGTVYRRINAVIIEGWLVKVGLRPGQVEGESVLYELTLKGKAALNMGEKDIAEFLKTESYEKLAKLFDLI